MKKEPIELLEKLKAACEKNPCAAGNCVQRLVDDIDTHPQIQTRTSRKNVGIYEAKLLAASVITALEKPVEKKGLLDRFKKSSPTTESTEQKLLSAIKASVGLNADDIKNAMGGFEKEYGGSTSADFRYKATEYMRAINSSKSENLEQPTPK
ncbi:MAG: hypothetical protein M3R00_01775 [Pseudomonadota bacterium]|nr:hypothetical protein [Pseudomonadota bacterium]